MLTWVAKNISPEYFLETLLETVVSPPFFSQPAQAWGMVEGSYIFTHTYVCTIYLKCHAWVWRASKVACSHIAQTVGTKVDHPSTWYGMTIIKRASTDQKGVMRTSKRCQMSNPMHHSDKIDISLFDTIFVSKTTKGQVGQTWAWSLVKRDAYEERKTWRT